MPQSRQDVVTDIKNNLSLEDAGAKEMAKAEEDTAELKRLVKYEQAFVLFKNTNNWDTSIVEIPDEEAEFDQED